MRASHKGKQLSETLSTRICCTREGKTVTAPLRHTLEIQKLVILNHVGLFTINHSDTKRLQKRCQNEQKTTVSFLGTKQWQRSSTKHTRKQEKYILTKRCFQEPLYGRANSLYAARHEKLSLLQKNQTQPFQKRTTTHKSPGYNFPSAPAADTTAQCTLWHNCHLHKNCQSAAASVNCYEGTKLGDSSLQLVVH